MTAGNGAGGADGVLPPRAREMPPDLPSAAGHASPETCGGWLPTIRRYLAAVLLGNLVWEFAHMPLYTLWRTGTPAEIAFAALHCTGGDVLIATASLVLALLVAGQLGWPGEGHRRVAMVTIALGLGYTVFSEWLNVEVRQSWAYADLMPTLPWLGTGLSPVMQWLVVPAIAFWRGPPTPPPPRARTRGGTIAPASPESIGDRPRRRSGASSAGC